MGCLCECGFVLDFCHKIMIGILTFVFSHLHLHYLPRKNVAKVPHGSRPNRLELEVVAERVIVVLGDPPPLLELVVVILLFLDVDEGVEDLFRVVGHEAVSPDGHELAGPGSGDHALLREEGLPGVEGGGHQLHKRRN